MTDPIRAALERLHQYAEIFPEHDTDSIVARARAELLADGPAVPDGREPAAVVEQPSDEELESFLLDAAAEQGDIYWAEPLVLARAVLARWGHQPAPPAEGEMGELVAALRDAAFDLNGSDPAKSMLTRAADLLEQRHPVPVSERPWAREGWCDEAGRCWFGAPQDGAADAGWILRKPLERLSHQTVSLPAHALPLPAGEVQP